MKRPSAASLKRVTPANLAALGADRLAELLIAAAANRPELKRRLRMELAAEQGADHLLAEIDKRLTSLETGRSKVSWRQRPTFVRDLDGLRVLIGGRLAALDSGAALDRLWRFMDVAGRLAGRVRDRDGSLAAVFERAASDIGDLLSASGDPAAAGALAHAVARDPEEWTGWLPRLLERSGPGLPKRALVAVSELDGAVAAWMPPLRRLADAAGDAGAYRATFTAQDLRTPEVAAEVARRLLAAGQVEEAGHVLRGAPSGKTQGGPHFDWETVWIDYLDGSDQADAAQAARWSSFERTLAPERLRAFTRRLPDFDDVEAEDRAFRHAAAFPDKRRALQFLIGWPALPEAAALVHAHGVAAAAAIEPDAETWAERLRARQPGAAAILLQIAAKAALRRRDRPTGERLMQEAKALEPAS